MLQMVLEAPASVLCVERLSWAKRMPDIRVCPDGEETLLVATMKTIERKSGCIDGLWIRHLVIAASEPGRTSSARYRGAAARRETRQRLGTVILNSCRR
jgi:hypothetical protein